MRLLESKDAEIERLSVISSASLLSEEALRLAFLAGVEDAVGPERCGAEYDAPSREYARRAIDRLSASAPSPEDKGSDTLQERAAEALGKFEAQMREQTIPAIVEIQAKRHDLAIASRDRVLLSDNVEDLRDHLRNANAYIAQLEAARSVTEGRDPGGDQ